MKIGYIGLGIMGAPCAQRLLDAGFELYVYARRPEQAQPLLNQGARWCDTPAQMAQQVDLLFSNVSDTPDVEAIMLGQNGVIESAHAGLIVIDMSTILALRTQYIAARLKEHGIIFLDAPVSGGQIGAQQGTLTIMVGGDRAALERAMPALSILGQNITHVGASGAGQIAKACNQIIVSVTMAGVAEAQHLAESAGVDFSHIRTALLGGFAYSKILEVHGQRMLTQQFAPGFKARLHQKDMRIVHDTATALGLNLTAADDAKQRIDQLVADGHGELDSSAIVRIKKQPSSPQ